MSFFFKSRTKDTEFVVRVAIAPRWGLLLLVALAVYTKRLDEIAVAAGGVIQAL
jgi:hypothetical protein